MRMLTADVLVHRNDTCPQRVMIDQMLEADGGCRLSPSPESRFPQRAQTQAGEGGDVRRAVLYSQDLVLDRLCFLVPGCSAGSFA